MPTDSGLNPIHFLSALAVYLIALIAIGWFGHKAQRTRSLSEFYLAGRSFGFVVLFLTLYATQYSGNTFMAFPGQTYRFGIGYIYSIAMMMSIILGYLLFAPRLVVLAREHGYLTPTDAIFHRFPHSGIRVVSALLLSWGLINYILAQLVAIGRAMEGLMGEWLGNYGINAHVTAVISLALVMVIYESLGGMRAVAWSDVIQGLMLLFGLILIAYFAVTEFGGLAESVGKVQETSLEKLAVPNWATCREMFSGIVLLFLGGAMYPHAIQRLYAARNLKTLKRSLAAMVFLPFLSTLPVFLLGLVALAQFPGLDRTGSDTVTALLLARLVEISPAVYWAVIFVFVAAIAAIMSTADSALLSLSSSITQDLYRPLFKKPPDQRHLYRVGKIVSWAVMVVLVWIAADAKFTLWKLLEMKFEFLMQVFPAFAIGLYSKRLTSRWVLAGMVAGTALSFGIHYASGIEWISSAKPWSIHAGLWGLVLNMLICFAGICFSPNPKDQ